MIRVRTGKRRKRDGLGIHVSTSQRSQKAKVFEIDSFLVGGDRTRPGAREFFGELDSEEIARRRLPVAEARHTSTAVNPFADSPHNEKRRPPLVKDRKPPQHPLKSNIEHLSETSSRALSGTTFARSGTESGTRTSSPPSVGFGVREKWRWFS